MIKPVYEDMAKQYDESVAFGLVDIDDNEDAAIEFEISAVPTFVFFDGQNATERFSGADPAKLSTFVRELADR